MGDLPEIAVFSDGCRLCKEAIAAMRQAAAERADRIVEIHIDSVPKELAAKLGVRATPAIVFNDEVAAIGVPSDEQAAMLLMRAELDQVILRYAIPKSEAIQKFAEGRIPTEAAARGFAAQFYAFSEEFPLFLCAAISHVRDDSARLLLVHNLYEEHGNLAGVDRLHPALFRAFCRGVGLNIEELDHQDETAPGLAAARKVMEICRQGPAYRALAALYPVELMFGPTCDIIIRGLRHLPLPSDAVDYWHIHSSSGVEVEHAEQMRQALFRACHGAEEWRQAIEVSEEVAQMFFRIFDQTARAFLQEQSAAT